MFTLGLGAAVLLTSGGATTHVDQSLVPPSSMAWGAPVNGIQCGLAVKPEYTSDFRQVVRVYIRNGDKRVVTVRYEMLRQFGKSIVVKNRAGQVQPSVAVPSGDQEDALPGAPPRTTPIRPDEYTASDFTVVFKAKLPPDDYSVDLQSNLSLIDPAMVVNLRCGSSSFTL
jgi:hypothetical protein